MFYVRYYRPGESDPFFADDHSEPPLPEIGDGLIWGDGTRYRVADRWLSFDHHGHFEEAWHVFLEPIDAGGADDRPGRLVPRYFGVE